MQSQVVYSASSDSISYDALIIELTYWEDPNPIERKINDCLHSKHSDQVIDFFTDRNEDEFFSQELYHDALIGLGSLMNSHYDDSIDEKRWNYRRAMYLAYLALVANDQDRVNYVDLGIFFVTKPGSSIPRRELEGVYLGLSILKLLIAVRDHPDLGISDSILDTTEQLKGMIPTEVYQNLRTQIQEILLE